MVFHLEGEFPGEKPQLLSTLARGCQGSCGVLQGVDYGQMNRPGPSRHACNDGGEPEMKARPL